jgi:hypothetical protein
LNHLSAASTLDFRSGATSRQQCAVETGSLLDSLGWPRLPAACSVAVFLCKFCHFIILLLPCFSVGVICTNEWRHNQTMLLMGESDLALWVKHSVAEIHRKLTGVGSAS